MTVYNESLQCVHQHMDSGKIWTVVQNMYVKIVFQYLFHLPIGII